MAGNGHVAGGKEGCRKIGGLEGLGAGIPKIAGVDYPPVGEDLGLVGRVGIAGNPVSPQHLGMSGQKVLHHHQVAVDKDNDGSLGVAKPQVAGGSRAAVFLAQKPDRRQIWRLALQPFQRAIGGAVVHHHHLVAVVGARLLLRQGLQTFLQDGTAVVGGDDDADVHRGSLARKANPTPKVKGFFHTAREL